MAYLVNLTVRAERDLRQVFLEIEAERSDAAPPWRAQAIQSLGFGLADS
jgi:hypothetical protein